MNKLGVEEPELLKIEMMAELVAERAQECTNDVTSLRTAVRMVSWV